MTHSRKRSATALTVLAVLATLAVAAGAAGRAEGSPRVSVEQKLAARDTYWNRIAPLAQPELQAGDEVAVGADGKVHAAAQGTANERLQERLRRNTGGFPPAAKQLAALEQQAVRTGRNPRQLKQAKGTQVAKLLTVLVEFDPNANDDFSGWQRPVDINADTSDPATGCVTEPAGTTYSGPVHNQIGNPATAGSGHDNNNFWVPDFSRQHYEQMLYSTTGLQQRVRPELTGPDGKPGIDLRGRTMRNMYREMSRGAYDITGQVVGWVRLPHSEAWYTADPCTGDPTFDVGGDVGHPDNERGASQMVVDAVDEIAAAQPGFPWADYDVEDQGDVDEDGNLFEPDGVIDHFVIVHAGSGEEGGGGAQGTYSLWSHSSGVDAGTGGYAIPGAGGIRVFNYIAQPENGGVGVFAHEYGHDLGLPDLYDTSGAADSDVDFWDLMSSGSHSGELVQALPTSMGAWDRFFLGWIDPEVVDVGSNAHAVQLGQAALTPRGTRDAIRVDLPQKSVTLATPHSGGQMWWSNNDQSWADVRLARRLDVPAGDDVRFWLWNDYVTEEDWDFGFVEVSTDGGSTWTQLKVYDEAGDLVSTDDDYDDPHGRLHDYGDLTYGLTGSSDGWRHDWVDLSAYAGSSVDVRLRYATDAGFEERGWFADDFSLTADGVTAWSDDVEGGTAGWTAGPGSFAGTSGAGWVVHSGTFHYDHYYLAEWRNFSGFDNGLRYAYDTNFARTDASGEWSVEKYAYNAPGLLVWYRDLQYANNHVTEPAFNGPSIGSKGSLLLVDSHFDPLRRTGAAALHDGSSTDNLQSRPQSSNAAFTTQGTYPLRECIEFPAGSLTLECTQFGSLPGVPTFTDAKGWYPGIEVTATGGLRFRDSDASVVVPSKGQAFYTTRVVDLAGNPFPAAYGLDLGVGSLLGSGDPDQGPDPEHPTDVSNGVSFSIKRVGQGNAYATVWVQPAKP
jgi:immune inhibitor A